MAGLPPYPQSPGERSQKELSFAGPSDGVVGILPGLDCALSLGTFRLGGGCPSHPKIWTRVPLAHDRRTSEMTFVNQSFPQAANSPASHEAAETAKSMGEEVRDFAGDVGRMAGKQYGRAQDMAVDTFDETYAAMRRNPLLTLGIALGIGFAFGVLTGVRR